MARGDEWIYRHTVVQTYGRTDIGNFSPFSRTSSSVGAAAQKAVLRYDSVEREVKHMKFDSRLIKSLCQFTISKC